METLLEMSAKEINRLEVLQRLDKKQLSQKEAGTILSLGVRQIKRLHKRSGLETTRTGEQQLPVRRDQTPSIGYVEEQISRVWSHTGAREVGGEGEAQPLEGKCAETHDRRAVVESA